MLVPELDRRGGSEIQALQLSTHLTQRGDFITILSDTSNSSLQREFVAGILIYRLFTGFGPFYVFLTVLRFMIQRRHVYQIVHSHGYSGTLLIACRVAKMIGSPVIMKLPTAGDFEHIFKKRDLKHLFYRRWIKKVDCFVAVSDEIEKEILSFKIPASKIVRIPNAVDSVKFSPPSPEQKLRLRSELNSDSKGKIVLYLGRLEKRKGIDYLLSAWEHNESDSLWIVGSGPEGPILKQMCEKLQLKGVRFFEATQDPLKFYQAADIFVFPSTKEGSPNVLLEAMSCGLPSIATRIGGVIDVMEHGKQGLLVSAHSVPELKNALLHAASHPDECAQWGVEAQRTVREKFELMKVAAQYKALYSRLIR